MEHLRFSLWFLIFPFGFFPHMNFRISVPNQSLKDFLNFERALFLDEAC